MIKEPVGYSMASLLRQASFMLIATQRQPSLCPPVEGIASPAEFSGLKLEWNALVSGTDDQIFYRHEFIETRLENYNLLPLLGRMLRSIHR